MPASFNDNLTYLMDRGGPVMWPLLALSIVAVALVFERCWFWFRLNHPWRLRRVARMIALLREDDLIQLTTLTTLTRDDRTLYGQVAAALTAHRAKPLTPDQAVQEHRGPMERFMPTLSTIISAAPMLGILGTVLGIISSFEALAEHASAADPRAVGRGIAEALITTAFGLSIAIAVVFPFNAFRAQIDRTLTRIEALVAAGSDTTRTAANKPLTPQQKQPPTP